MRVISISKILNSKYLTWIIIGLFVFQAMWIALSFSFPMIYDETAHVELIDTYSTQISPYTENAPENMTIQVSLFHYLMSFFYRTIGAIGGNFEAQVIALRLVCIAFFATGLLLMERLLKKININRSYINSALLVFILLPVTSLLGATVNYDNLLFPLTVLYMIIALDVLKKREEIDWNKIALLIAVGCLTALVKYTFLPIFVASLLFIFGYYIVTKRWRSLLGLRKLKFTKKSLPAIVFLVLIVGLFSLTYVRNVLVFHTVKPSCTQLHSIERCLSNGIVKRNLDAKATADQRHVGRLDTFSVIWVQNMVAMTGMTGSSSSGLIPSLPAIGMLVYFGSLFSIGVLLYAWRSLKKDIGWYFLLTMFLTLVLSVFYNNASGYYQLHAAYANQPRYLLSLLLIFIAMSMVAFGYALRRHRSLRLFALTITLLAFTQGGGLITHILRSDSSWYWQSKPVADINSAVKSGLKPIVKE